MSLTYDLDPDPHSISKLDPDPFSIKKLDPDLHKDNVGPKRWLYGKKGKMN
jgi:hypothetical protein